MTQNTFKEPETTDEAVIYITALARDGFDDWSSLGDIRATRDGDLLLLSYTHAAQYAARWNAWERACRGLVINTVAGYVAARPFDKFFNWGEGGRMTTAPLHHVMEKMDGSLIIAFWHGGYRAVTRGSFTSPQAAWAQPRLDALADGLRGIPAVWTLLFEAVYPENRIVVDYGGREGLYLLGMRHRSMGDYAPLDFTRSIADTAGIPTPRIFDRLDTVDDILRSLEGMDASEEGFVAVFEDGSRFKFKSAAYLALHKALSGLSVKSAVEAIRDGRVEDVRGLIPEELRAEWEGWVEETEATISLTRLTAMMRMAGAPRGDRKTFALWVNQQPEKWLRPMLFALKDGKDIMPMIFKLILDGGLS